MKDLGKPGAGDLHARIDERGLETEHGLGTAAPAINCVDSAGPIGHRASPRLYPNASGTALARQELDVLGANDQDTRPVTLYWLTGETLRPIQRRI